MFVVARWDGSTDLKQLFDEVLADRDLDKRTAWLKLLHENELHTVAQLRALDSTKWERLKLPIGIEQALQDALSKSNTQFQEKERRRREQLIIRVLLACRASEQREGNSR